MQDWQKQLLKQHNLETMKDYILKRVGEIEEQLRYHRTQKNEATSMGVERTAQLEIERLEARYNELYKLGQETGVADILPWV